jgi:hypothetical protein
MCFVEDFFSINLKVLEKCDCGLALPEVKLNRDNFTQIIHTASLLE